MSIISKFGGYYLDEYLYFVWARANSDHRSIDLTEPNALKKIIAFDIYKFLKKQRLETGTDYLNDKNIEALEEYEQSLLNNKRYMADKIRMFACIQIDNGNLLGGKELLLEAIKMAPTFVKNYQSYMYFLRAKRKATA